MQTVFFSLSRNRDNLFLFFCVSPETFIRDENKFVLELGRTRRIFCLFCKNICHQFRSATASSRTSKAPSSCHGGGRILVKRHFARQSTVKMENDEDFIRHYSYLKKLNATSIQLLRLAK